VSECSGAAKRNTASLKPLISDFLFHAAANVQDRPEHAEIWRGIIAILLGPGSDCRAQTLALVLQNAQAVGLVDRFAPLIVSQLCIGAFSEEDAIALFTILYDKAPEQIPSLVEIVCHEEQDRFVNFTMNALRKAVLRCQDPTIVDRAVEFSKRHFKTGGLALVGQLFVRNPTLGIDFLHRGALDEAVAAIDETIDLAKSSLQFLALVLFQTRHDSVRFDIALGAGRAALSAILKWSKDKRKGKEVIIDAIRVLRDADLVAKGSLRRIFAAATQNEREDITKVLDGIAAATKPAGPKLALKLFSGKSRRKGPEEGEWQALETDL
jgi:hypothetical protein